MDVNCNNNLAFTQQCAHIKKIFIEEICHFQWRQDLADSFSFTAFKEVPALIPALIRS